MLIGLSDEPKHKGYIIKYADKALMCALKMKQPNLHENVYILLKKSSKKTYKENDYIAWKNWFAEAKVRENRNKQE